MITYRKTGTPQALSAPQRKNPRAAVAAAKRAGGFVWIGLEDPDENEMAELAEALGLHPLAVSDAVTGRQQPKVQDFDEHLFVVLWALVQRKRSQVPDVGTLLLFLRDGLLLTVQRDTKSDPIDIAGMLEDRRTPVSDGALGGLYSVMYAVSIGYSDLASEIERKLEKLEEQVFDRHRTESADEIYRLRQQIGKLQRAVSSLARALETSEEHLAKVTVGHEEVEPYLRDLMADLAGTAQLISDQGVALDGVLSSHENNVASQQNVDTRKISAFAALLSVPTVLAGLYGMNFKNLPGVSWAFGWESVIAAVIILDVVMFINFKRRHWL
jgi:magnesium transporter